MGESRIVLCKNGDGFEVSFHIISHSLKHQDIGVRDMGGGIDK